MSEKYWDEYEVRNEVTDFDKRLGFMELLEQFDVNGYELEMKEKSLTEEEQQLFADF